MSLPEDASHKHKASRFPIILSPFSRISSKASAQLRRPSLLGVGCQSTIRRYLHAVPSSLVVIKASVRLRLNHLFLQEVAKYSRNQWRVKPTCFAKLSGSSSASSLICVCIIFRLELTSRAASFRTQSSPNIQESSLTIFIAYPIMAAYIELETKNILTISYALPPEGMAGNTRRLEKKVRSPLEQGH